MMALAVILGRGGGVTAIVVILGRGRGISVSGGVTHDGSGVLGGGVSVMAVAGECDMGTVGSR